MLKRQLASILDSMAITDRTRKVLWAKAGGRCSMCATQLVTDAFETDDPSVVGEEAHIVARSPNGPRANKFYHPTTMLI